MSMRSILGLILICQLAAPPATAEAVTADAVTTDAVTAGAGDLVAGDPVAGDPVAGQEAFARACQRCHRAPAKLLAPMATRPPAEAAAAWQSFLTTHHFPGAPAAADIAAFLASLL